MATKALLFMRLISAVNLFCLVLFLTRPVVAILFFSKSRLILHANLIAKKRLNSLLGTCFLYKSLAPPPMMTVKANLFHPFNVSSYVFWPVLI